MTKIMVVEDDASLREIYGIRVAAEGYDVVSAGDGEEALAMAVREKPDLILADIVLGGGVVDIVAHGVIHGINREQDVPFLRRVDLHHGVTGFPVLLVHLGLERGGLYGVAAVEPHTVIDVLGVKGSSTHFDYLLS